MREYLRKSLCILLAVAMALGMVPQVALGEELGQVPEFFWEWEDEQAAFDLPGFDESSPMALEFLVYDEIEPFAELVPFTANVANVCAFCVVENMGPGWNLGNTFDGTHIGHGSSCSCIPDPHNPPGGASGTGIWACGGNNTYASRTATQLETMWMGGSVNATTQQTIQNVYNAGFRTIRIPVTWYKATTGPPNWPIRADFMARVRNVVRWAYEVGEDGDRMTIILNTHHEELIFADWLVTNIAGSTNFIEQVWTQIAREFGNFGERLIFEGLNEPRVRAGGGAEWLGSPAQRTGVNTLNQAFVNAVRATENTHPNNRYRILMVPTLAASAAQAPLDAFTRPNDPTGNDIRRIAMSIHAYEPNNFAGVGGGPMADDWAESAVTTMMTRVMGRANTLDMPVIFGEWGAVSRSTNTLENRRVAYATFYAQEAARRRAAHVWWDNGATRHDNHDAIEGNFGLFRRRNEQWQGRPVHLGSGANVPHMGLVFDRIPPAILTGHSQGVNLRTGESRCQCIAITSADNLTVQQGVAETFPLTSNRPGATFLPGVGTGNVPPAGVTVSGGNLNIAATVAAGTHTFQIRVQSGPLNSVQNFTLVVVDPSAAPPGSNYRNLNMTPGTNETVMHFTWHSGSATGGIRIWPQGRPGEARTINASFTQSAGNHIPVPFTVNRPGGEGGIARYYVHQATVSNLTPNTVYQYTVIWMGGESTPKSFRTGGASGFQFIVSGDPQIGTGGIEFDRGDWANAMMNASRMFPHAQMIVSMGDQVASATIDPDEGLPANTSAVTPNPLQLRGAQRRFDGLFYPRQLHSLPLAPVVGNHDNDLTSGGRANINPFLWRLHYNVPNRAQRSSSPPTNFDYWFRYGSVLFIQLDSNARAMGGTRTAWFNDVVAQNSDALWRVVLLHHSPYSPHRASTYTAKQDIISNWIPLFEENYIDIVFGGHDHIYSRSHHMRRGSGSAPTARLEQRFVNSQGVVRQGNFGATYHAVLNPTGITYIAFGSPTRSNVRYATPPARPYLVRYHSVYTTTGPTGTPTERYGAHGRHISNVTVTPTTFTVSTYELNNAAPGQGNQFRMVDIYTIVRNPGSTQVPPNTYIPQFIPGWRPVPDPYIDIPFNWNPNRRPHHDANVTHGATDHVRVLDGVDITPCIIDSDDDVVLQINYFPIGNNSNRRLLAWTDLSGTGAPANRNSIAFLTSANLSGPDRQVAISDRVEEGDTTAEIVIPPHLLSSGPNTATRIYIAMGIDAGPTGHPTGGDPNRYTMPADQRGGGTNNEFSRIESVQLIARAASGITNPMACGECSNLPCRCVESNTVEFRLNGGERTNGGELTQRVPLGAGAEAPIIQRAGHIHTWSAPFHAVTEDTIVYANWISLVPPINVLYDMQTTDRIGTGFGTFAGAGGLAGARVPEFAPLSRTGGAGTTFETFEVPRAIEVTGRGGVANAVRLSFGGTYGFGSTNMPTTAERMYRIEFTGILPAGGTPRIRFEGLGAALTPPIPGSSISGGHTLVDAPDVAPGEVFTHSVTLTAAQVAAIGTRYVSLSANPGNIDITMLNVRIIEHGVGIAVTYRSVAFNSNGGTGTMATASVANGTNFTVPGNGFTAPANHIFVGWLREPGGTTHQPGTTITNVTADFTLVAQWELVNRTIAFDANSGTGAMASQTVPHGTAFVIPANTFSRTNYTFAGWNTVADGSGTSFAPGATIPAVNADTTLFAQWAGAERQLTVNLHSGAGGPVFPAAIPQTAWTIPATPVPTRAHYTFGGWSLTADGVAVTQVSAGATAIAIHALWTRTEWPLATLVPPAARTLIEPAATSDAVITQLQGAVPTVAITTSPARDATANITWSFSGTFSAAEGAMNQFTWTAELPAGVVQVGGTPAVSGNVAITNHTAAIVNHTVTFDLAGGNLVSGNLVQTVADGSSAVPPVVTRLHYALAWVGAYANVTSTRTITAQWTRTAWPLASLDAPGATFLMTAPAANYGAVIAALQTAVVIATNPVRDTTATLSWTVDGTFNPAEGAQNRFNWTANLPADVYLGTFEISGYTIVTNHTAAPAYLVEVTPPLVGYLTLLREESASSAAALAAIRTLASTAVATTSLGGTPVYLAVEWTLVGEFNPAQGAQNEFAWSITDFAPFLPGDAVTSGTFEVTNFSCPPTCDIVGCCVFGNPNDPTEMIITINVVNEFGAGMAFEGTRVSVSVRNAPPNVMQRIETNISFNFRANPLVTVQIPVVVDVDIDGDGEGDNYFFKSLADWNEFAREYHGLGTDESVTDVGHITTNDVSTASYPPVICRVYSPAAGMNGIPFTAFTFTATGAQPVTWAVTGTLPAGLNFSESGVLSGTPTAVGESTFTVTATNTFGTDSREVTVVIHAAGTASVPQDVTGIRPDGLDFSQQLTVDGPDVRSWSAEFLPPGLNLTTDGILYGAPVFAGTHYIRITTENHGGVEYTRDIPITVFPRHPVHLDNATPTLMVSHEFADAAGEYVTVSFRLANNPGFTRMSLHVSIPEGLYLTEYESHPHLSEERQFMGPLSSSDGTDAWWRDYGAIFAWLPAPPTDLPGFQNPADFAINGPILTATFRVLPGANVEEITAEFATGRWLNVPHEHFAVEVETPVNNAGVFVNFAIESGSVTVCNNFILGDTNRDGRVTSADATHFARWLAWQYIRVFDRRAAELYQNGNGGPATNDLTFLARWLVGHNVGAPGRNNGANSTP